jgi:XTP/dITP diphosphohydrolase
MTLVFATHNLHKLEEVRSLAGNSFELKGLADIACFEDIPETGSTFHDNASLKSNFIYRKFNVNCFADDSGLEVDALNGEPGIYSARYSPSGDAGDNLQLVLDKMQNLSNRRANFRCVISLILNGTEYFFEGVVNGSLLTHRSGSSGFGYDPIFVPDGYDISFAEMPMDQKNKISHRGRAIEEMVKFLKTAPPK